MAVMNGFAINPNDCVGVIDHNEFLYTDGIAIYAFHKNWNNQGGASAGSWYAASGFGSSQFLFIENNTFTASNSMAALDCYGGARIVFRYNTCTKAHIEVHGTDSGGIFRGGRAFEVYNNTFTGATIGNYVINGRSGVFVVHGNVISSNPGAKFQLVYYRAGFPFSPWSDMDGGSVWDVNHASNPFYSGTASSGGALSVTVSGAGWMADQWKGYTIKKLTGGGTIFFGFITGNTSTTVTILAPARGELGDLTFAAGNTFEINKVIYALDMPGRSGGSLFAEEDPPVAPGSWNDQVNEASYQWNNSAGDQAPVFTSAPYEDMIVSGTHFINGTEKPGYTAYTYPHPLIAATEGGGGHHTSRAARGLASPVVDEPAPTVQQSLRTAEACCRNQERSSES